MSHFLYSFIHPRTLGHSHVLTRVKNAAMNEGVQIALQELLNILNYPWVLPFRLG